MVRLVGRNTVDSSEIQRTNRQQYAALSIWTFQAADWKVSILTYVYPGRSRTEISGRRTCISFPDSDPALAAASIRLLDTPQIQCFFYPRPQIQIQSNAKGNFLPQNPKYLLNMAYTRIKKF